MCHRTTVSIYHHCFLKHAKNVKKNYVPVAECVTHNLLRISVFDAIIELELKISTQIFAFVFMKASVKLVEDC